MRLSDQPRFVQRTRSRNSLLGKSRISGPPGGKAFEFPTVTAQETSDRVARDPLANLKRLDENRPGFHWRATPRREGAGGKKGDLVKKAHEDSGNQESCEPPHQSLQNWREAQRATRPRVI